LLWFTGKRAIGVARPQRLNRPFSPDASDADGIGIERDSSGFSPPLGAVLGYRVHCTIRISAHRPLRFLTRLIKW
jgi:hypothetical protein